MRRDNFNFQTVMPFTATVKGLIIVNVVVWFLFQVILDGFAGWQFQSYFSLVPEQFLFHFRFWQVFSYMFLHSVTGVTHVVLNMLMLWMFGGELELLWGRRFFLFYYIACGAGAGLLYALVLAVYAQLSGSMLSLQIPVVGASGALFGLMVAQGILFGDRMVHFFMLFPMRAKYFVMILGFIQFASLITSNISGGGVSYLAHLGGLVVGYFILWSDRKWKNIKNGRRRKSKNQKNLRLVVDNDAVKGSQSDKTPKYWN